MLSKRQYEQITGRRQKHEVIAYQIRQSFKPGEITPEEANRLGHELALRFTKGKYAFIVATHTDRAHVHNHIVFNSTSIDATRKFKNFWLSSFALQRVSDLICLENGLLVIAPKPYKERTKRTEYPRRVKNRDVLCEDIDLILQKKSEFFDTFLQELQQLNYEIKYRKHISVRGKNQTRFIRLSSLEDGIYRSRSPGPLPWAAGTQVSGKTALSRERTPLQSCHRYPEQAAVERCRISARGFCLQSFQDMVNL